MKFIAQICVQFKTNVLDTQAKAVHHALNDLGYGEVMGVKISKYIEITIDSASKEKANTRVHEMCERLLVNKVIENFYVTFISTNKLTK